MSTSGNSCQLLWAQAVTPVSLIGETFQVTVMSRGFCRYGEENGWPRPRYTGDRYEQCKYIVKTQGCHRQVAVSTGDRCGEVTARAGSTVIEPALVETIAASYMLPYIGLNWLNRAVPFQRVRVLGKKMQQRVVEPAFVETKSSIILCYLLSV